MSNPQSLIERKMKDAGMTTAMTMQEAYEAIEKLFITRLARDIAADIFDGWRYDDEFLAMLERGETENGRNER